MKSKECQSVSHLDDCRCELEAGHDGDHEHAHSTGRMHWWSGE